MECAYFVCIFHFRLDVFQWAGYVQTNVDINCINAYRWTGESVRYLFAYIDVYSYISHMNKRYYVVYK